MPNKEINEYYDVTRNKKIREDLVFSVNRVTHEKIAIDCGCGAGADINYLLKHGFTIHGFDIEQESISRCQLRFRNHDRVHLYKSKFIDFVYPKASLVVADASLFFCPNTEFKEVWNKIQNCLFPKGIFCGSFLGKEDNMVLPKNSSRMNWSNTTVFDEKEVKKLFENFNLLRFNTFKSKHKDEKGTENIWHIFQVVAQKND